MIGKRLLISLCVFISMNLVLAQKNMWIISQTDGHAFINKDGEIVLKTPYKNLSDFKDGLACFQDSTISGYIDQTGKVILEGKNFNFDFSNGLAMYIMEDSKITFIDKKGRIITPKFENYTFLFQTMYDVTAFSEGLASIIIRKPDDREWHNEIYINKKGEKVFNRQFENAANFSEGLARVHQLDGKIGYINKKGKLVIKLNKGEGGDGEFKEGFADIMDSLGNVHFIDKRGLILANSNYIRVSPFSDGMARVEINNKLGFINTKGKLVIPAIYNYASTYDFNNGIAPVSIDSPMIPGKHITFLIDKKGNRISKEFNNNAIIRPFNGDLAFGTQPTDDFNCDIHFYINRKGVIVWQDTICSDQNVDW